MITTLILSFVVLLVHAIFFWLPVVTIADIPVIGTYISSALITAIHVWNAFLLTFPYAVTPWYIFLYIIIPFELLLLLAKFLLGSRMPAHVD